MASKYSVTYFSFHALTRTQFGLEFEVVAKTKLDSHKAEQAVNHWMLVTDSEDGANDWPSRRKKINGFTYHWLLFLKYKIIELFCLYVVF